MKHLFILLFAIITITSTAQRKYDSEYVFEKKEITNEEILHYETLIDQIVVERKEKMKNEKLASMRGYSENGTLLVKYKASTKEGKKIEDYYYPTLHLFVKKTDGVITSSKYNAYLVADPTRKLEIATTVIDYETESYTFSTDIPSRKAFENQDLYIRYVGDDNWSPLGKGGKNLEPLLAFDQGAYTLFKKGHKKNTMGNIVMVGSMAGGLALGFTVNLPAGIVIAIGGASAGAFMADKSKDYYLSSVALYNKNK